MLYWRLASALALATAVAASSSSYADDPKKDDIDRSVVQQGFDASPIPKEKLNFKGKDPAMVGLGSYLVNAGADCNGCHTFPRFLRPRTVHPGDNGNFTGNVNGLGSNPKFGNPYLDPPGDAQPLHGQLQANTNADTTHGTASRTLAGVPTYQYNHFLGGGRCFGFFMSRNITPNDYGLPRGLTEAEFIQVMRQGKDISCAENRPVQNQPIYGGNYDPICVSGTFPPNVPGAGHSFNDAVLQTMSWPTYHSLTDTDLKAIYAYLSALPQATACNAAANGCAGFSNNPLLAGVSPGTPTTPAHVVGANQYIYPNTDDCPNNVNPASGNTIGTAPPQ